MFVQLSWHGSNRIVAKAARLAISECIFSVLTMTRFASPQAD